MTLRVNSTADLHDVEVRVTDPVTGGEKGVKLTQVGALDPVALLLTARVAGFGAAKYEAFNFLKGYDWAHSFNALQRHAALFWAGEDVDKESGLPHMAHAAWHAFALLSFGARGLGTDTRPPALVDLPELASVTREAFEAMVSYIPDVTVDWNGGDPALTRATTTDGGATLPTVMRADNFDRLAQAANGGEPVLAPFTGSPVCDGGGTCSGCMDCEPNDL